MAGSSSNNKGRRRIKIARLEKESDMYAAFSKRRNGIFKKASELCTYCDVELAIILFSPGMKPYSFGHPSVETIINRFLSQQQNSNPGSGSGSSRNNNPVVPGDDDGISKHVEAQKRAEIQGLNDKLDGILNRIAAERKRLESMKKRAKEEEDKHWWKGPVGKINDVGQLEALKTALNNLKISLLQQATKVDRNVVSKIINSLLANAAAVPRVPMFGNYYNNVFNLNIGTSGDHGSGLFNSATFPNIDNYDGTGGGSGFDINFQNVGYDENERNHNF